MTKALRKLIESLPRYKNFTLLDESKPFNEFFKNQSFDCVQVHCVYMDGAAHLHGTTTPSSHLMVTHTTKK